MFGQEYQEFTRKHQELNKEESPLWLVVHSYKYGEDYHIADSYENALIQACNIIAQWLYNIEDEQTRKSLVNLIQQELWEDAFRTWNNFQSFKCNKDNKETVFFNGNRELIGIIQLPAVGRVLSPTEKPDLSSFLENTI